MAGAQQRQNILVTVGMGPWPFDRLLEALPELAAEHDVFAQTGTSKVDPGCPHAAFIGYEELVDRMAAADIVITHAGNTVRLVQRAGGVPIAIAREHARGEMGNDHQVAYLRQEEEHGRVIAVWDTAALADAVAKHSIESERMLAERRLDSRAEPQQVADLLDDTVARLTGRPRRAPVSTPGWDAAARPAPFAATAATVSNPFVRHPLRRYDFAWRQLAGLPGEHLDLGAGHGDFAGPFARTTGRPVTAVDAMPGYVEEISRRCPQLRVTCLTADGRVPLADASFSSVSLLDVLEHTADERLVLGEVHRLLADDGIVVLTVPHRHVFSMLDPDNAKFRWPRLHKAAYRRRFGAEAYQQRFGDTSDGFVGDVAVERGWHTNYRTADLLALLRESGFEPVTVEGANLFWRWFHLPYLLGGPRTRSVCATAIRVDGTVFHSPRWSANLHIVARRLP